MSNKEDNRLVSFPNLGDYEIADKIKGLRRVFIIHQRILEKTGQSYPYYPEEIEEYLVNYDVYKLWEDTEYETIEELYVQSWMSYIESVFEEYVYFTVDEFLNGSAEDILQKDR